MERDQQLKQLLLRSTDPASADLTEAIMNRIHSLPGKAMTYKPLIAKQWQRYFLIAFCALTFVIISLCAILIFLQLPSPAWLHRITLPDINYNKLLLFVVLFWIVYGINAMIEKKVWGRVAG